MRAVIHIYDPERTAAGLHTESRPRRLSRPADRSPTCSCGDHSVHVMFTRTTADGFRVRIYSDGQVVVDPGHRGQTFPCTERELRAARAMAHHAGWHDAIEIPAVHRALVGVHERLVSPSPADERAAIRTALEGT